MKLTLKFILFFFFLGIIHSAYAQKDKSKFSFPQNDYILIPRFNSEEINVKINVKNLFDDLIFVKRDSIFEGEFIIDYKFASIKNPDRIYQRNISEKIKTSRFKDTNSRHKYAYLKDEINIKPDKYIFSLKGYSANGTRELFNFSDSLKWDTQKELTASDFIVLKKDSSIFVGRKNIPFGLYGTFIMPVYWSPETKVDSVGFFLYTENREKLLGRRILKIDEPKKYLEIPEKVEILPEGEYELYALFYSERNIIKTHKHSFNVIWMGKPWSLREFGLALKPLQLALGEEYEILFKSSSASKEMIFEKYWQRIDPTPNSEFNELQSEFYLRADEVHIKYGSERKYGWETDLGEIFLKYGPPDEINDQSLNPFGDEYIEWKYFSAGLKFLFFSDGKEYQLRQVKKLGDEN